MTITLTVHGAILAASALTERDGENADYRKIEPEWDYEDLKSLVDLPLEWTGTTLIDEHRNVVGWRTQ